MSRRGPTTVIEDNALKTTGSKDLGREGGGGIKSQETCLERNEKAWGKGNFDETKNFSA